MPEHGGAHSYQLLASGHRGTRAIKRLVEYAPASGGLALWMQHRDVQEVPASVPFTDTDNRHSAKPWVIGNDGKTLFYGSAFTQRSLQEQTGLIAHQVLHVALRHVDRERELQRRLGQIDAELYALCADAIVNASLSHLTWMQLPKGSVHLDTLLLNVLGIEQPLDVSLHQWDTETLYQAIDDREASAGGGQNRQSRSGSSNPNSSSPETGSAKSASSRTTPQSPHQPPDSSNQHSQSTALGYQTYYAEQTSRQAFTDGPKSHAARQLAATIIRDLIPNHSESPETNTEQALLWNERLLRAHATDAEQSFMRQLLADNTVLKTPWEQILRTQVQRALTLQPDINWSRPTRSWIANRGRTASGHRMPWQPGTSYSTNAPRLCIMVDVSGSVDNQLMQRFANEMDRIIRTFKTQALLIVGDDAVRDQQLLKPGVSVLRSVKFHGGGGTNFVPLIEAANRFKPDIGVFLTDLEGPAGEPPSWPVVWAVPASATAQPVPYGRYIDLS